MLGRYLPRPGDVQGAELLCQGAQAIGAVGACDAGGGGGGGVVTDLWPGRVALAAATTAQALDQPPHPQPSEQQVVTSQELPILWPLIVYLNLSKSM